MNVQFKKGALELIVLLIIKRRSVWLFTCTKYLRYMTIAEGTVYPLLRRLVKSGELSTYYQPSTEGPSRKYYQLTQQGLRG